MSVAPAANRPRRFQFSLGLLLIAIAWVSVVCVALKMPTAAWCGGMFLLAAIGLLASAVGIIYQAGRSRAFAVGYCVFSFGYAASLFFVEKEIGGHAQFPIDSKLPTTQLADWLFIQWHQGSVRTVTAPAAGYGGGMGGMGGGGFGGGGMGGSGFGGGGGMFSVDSSEAAVQSDADAEDSAGAASDEASGDPTNPATGEEAAEDSAVDAAAMSGEASGDVGMAMPGMGSGMSGMPAGAPPGAGMPAPGMVTYTVALYDSSHFRVIVHSILAMFLGLLGGLIAQYFYATRREAPRGAPAGNPPAAS